MHKGLFIIEKILTILFSLLYLLGIMATYQNIILFLIQLIIFALLFLTTFIDWVRGRKKSKNAMIIHIVFLGIIFLSVLRPFIETFFIPNFHYHILVSLQYSFDLLLQNVLLYMAFAILLIISNFAKKEL